MLLDYLAYVNYGDRFKELRKEHWKGTLLELARRLGSPYPATIYNIEKLWRVPTLTTVDRHAAAIGCAPWDLLVNVETEYDLARGLATVRRDIAFDRWRDLLKRYQETTRRGKKGIEPKPVIAKKRGRGGRQT